MATRNEIIRATIQCAIDPANLPGDRDFALEWLSLRMPLREVVEAAYNLGRENPVPKGDNPVDAGRPGC